MTFVTGYICILYGLLLSFKGCQSIEMANNVTKQLITVENGTADEILLDCPYILEEQDVYGLVIKWYYGGIDNQIFQWIPNDDRSRPQLNQMTEVIDLDHEVSSDPLHKHRALRFVAPTTEVTGTYTCVVSSHYSERKLDIDLIVYSLPSALSLTVNETDSGNVSVVCISEPAFPEPTLELSLKVAERRMPLEVERETNWSQGLYNSTLSAIVDADDVAAAPIVEFICTLSIPHSNLSVTETLKYRSDGLPIYDEHGIEGSNNDDYEEKVIKIGASTHQSGINGAGVTEVFNGLLLAAAIGTACFLKN